MALKATVFKVSLSIADMDRHYYQTHQLTLARHPSETDERMMIRLVAFALNAEENLLFGRGLSTDDEPDLWQKDLTGEIEHWVEVGVPDERRIRKACGRAQQVSVYSYGGGSADNWFDQNQALFAKQSNLKVLNLKPEDTKPLALLVDRTMDLQCSIDDGQVYLNNGQGSVEINPLVLL